MDEVGLCDEADDQMSDDSLSPGYQRDETHGAPSDVSPVHEIPAGSDGEEHLTMESSDLISRQCCSERLVLSASVFAAVGGLLFGYDTGIISGALPQLMTEFELTCQQAEFVVSTLLIGAVIASVIAGSMVDIFGRKRAVIVNSVLFMIGAVVQAAAVNLPMLIIGRLVIGFGVSMSAIAECIYIAEISPVNRRGFLVSLNEFSITVGFLLAYLISYCFINVFHGWRYMFGLGILPAVVQCVGMVFMPSSPRYLVLKDHKHRAKKVLQSLRPNESIEFEFRNIEASIILEKNMGYRELLSMKDNMLARVLIGTGLVILQQITGQPNVLYYAPMIFGILGMSDLSSATLATVGLGVVKVLATGMALYNLDRFGRRSGLIAGATLMCVSILALGAVTCVYESSFSVVDPCDVNASARSGNSSVWNGTLTGQVVAPRTKRSVDVLIGGYSLLPQDQNFVQYSRDIPSAANNKQHLMNTSVISTEKIVYLNNQSHQQVSYQVIDNAIPTNLSQLITASQPAAVSQAGLWIMVLALMGYVAGYAIGFGPGTWLVLSEVFPVSVRGRALSIAVVANWAVNLAVSVSFLSTMSVVGASATFFCYAVMCAISVAYVWLLVPETKGKSLEEISVSLQAWTLRKRLRAACSCETTETRAYRPVTTEMSSPLHTSRP